MTNEELVSLAASVLNPQRLGQFYVADVGCALLSATDEAFTGACVGGELGICAEQSAVSNMVRTGRPRIKRIVAVWRDEHGELHVIPPCGRCREFLRTMDQANLEAEVILGPGRVVRLKELLPYPGWHAEKV